MTGIVKSFAEEKGYGFIKGDNKKDYFFHKSSVDKKEKICEGAVVDFEEKATPKGYSAVKIRIDGNVAVKYKVPDTIYTSKENKVNGWDTIERSSWRVYSYSKNPDEARNEIMIRASKIGANAIVNLNYSKSTESTVSDSGKGVYHYSLHHFGGDPINIGKKSAVGTFEEKDLGKIDRKADKLKSILIERTESSKKGVFTYIVFCLFLLLIGGVVAAVTKEMPYAMPGIFLSVMGIFFVRHTDNDWWLEHK